VVASETGAKGGSDPTKDAMRARRRVERMTGGTAPASGRGGGKGVEGPSVEKKGCCEVGGRRRSTT